jgi:hypothetical protein
VSLIALTSVGGAPGATTTAFAMALTSPSQVLLAECSPAGGSILRGYFQCQTAPTGGLWDLALAAVKGPDAAEHALWELVVPLDQERQRLLLPGLSDPFLSTELSAATWETLAETFAQLPVTVIADVGPIGPEQPFSVLRAASLVIVVMRPTLAQVAAARPRLVRLRQALGPRASLGLCLIGERPYTASDIRTQLGEFAFTFILPVDPKAAAVLSDGGGSDRTRRKIDISPLMRAARTVSQTTTKFTTDWQHRRTEPESAAAREGRR